jgi:cytochrome c553
MKRSFFILSVICALAFTSCKKEAEKVTEAPKEKAPEKPAKKEFEMYEMSEMAALMEQMYAENMHLKERIAAGDTIGRFPQHFMKIHASAMTDESDNDAFFKEQAAKFIKAQERIYNDPPNAKKHFNDAVSACVKCHEQKCEGPIPRIKKLYIK